MTVPVDAILTAYDAGTSVAKTAAIHNVAVGTVYGVLRRHRPDRPRRKRSFHSEKRAMILGLLAQGIKPARVAFLTGCTRQWVHMVHRDFVDNPQICG